MNTSTNDVGLGFTHAIHIVCLSVFLVGGIAVLNSLIRIGLRTGAMRAYAIASLTGFDIVGKVLITHVGTRILIPHRICTFLNRIVILTVTATKHLVYLVGCINIKVGSRYWGRITAAIHLSDACQGTTVDNHLRTCRSLDGWVGRMSIRRVVFSQVTTAIDGKDIVFLVRDKASQLIKCSLFLLVSSAGDCCCVASGDGNVEF